MTLLDNKYFDRFRELAELELSRESKDLQFVLSVFLMFKRISASTKTEYAEKLLDITELVLSKLNKQLTDLSQDQLKLATVCFSIITDLVDVS